MGKMALLFVFAASVAYGDPPQYGNKAAQEYGDAVYTHLDNPASAVKDLNHTAIFSGIDSNYIADTRWSSSRVSQASGPVGFLLTGDTTVNVSLDDFRSHNSSFYFGAYTTSPNGLSAGIRRIIVANAQSIVDANIIYAIPVPISYNIFGHNVDDISSIRCDGLVEYSYEASAQPVWWPSDNPDHWNILIYPVDHTPFTLADFLIPASLPWDVLSVANPSKALTPWAQRGAPGSSPNPSNSNMIYPSVIKLPTYSVSSTSGSGYTEVRIQATDESGIHQIAYKAPGDSGWSYSPVQPQHPTSASYSYSIPVTQSGTLQVYAVDGGGNGDEAHAQGFAITVSGGTSSQVAPPLKPTDLTATGISSSQINISWKDNSTNETGYKVYRSSDGGVTWLLTKTLGANISAWSDTGLGANSTYSYQVAAYNSAGAVYSLITSASTLKAAATAASTLRIYSSGPSSGVAVTVWIGSDTSANITGTTPTSLTFAAGTVIGAVCPSKSADGQIFQKWQLDGVDQKTTTNTSVVMNGPHTLTAVYGTSAPAAKTLSSLSISGPSSVDEGSSAQYSATAVYSDGSTADVTSSVTWSEDSSYAGISSNGILDADSVSSDKSVVITASYKENYPSGSVTKTATKTVTISNTASTTNYTLTVNATNGYVNVSPTGSSYPAGTEVRLSAHPSSGYIFANWSGDASGSDYTTYVTMNGNKTVTGNFTVDTSECAVRVDIQPEESVSEGAMWKVIGKVSSANWQPSGNTFSHLLPGKYRITFNDIPGWETPADQVIDIAGGQKPAVIGIYKEILGTLQVSIQPAQAVQAGAHWRINGGTWQQSGTTLTNVPSGNNLLEFQPVSGWSTPQAQTLNIARASTVAVSGEYGPPAGLPVIASVSPSSGPIDGGTTVTVDGANFQNGATVTFGGVAAQAVTVVSPTQITAVTPSRASYGTVPLTVTSGGQSATQSNGFSYLVPQGQHMDLVGQVGGAELCVEVQGSTAYMGEGAGFVVLDVTNPASPIERGRLPMPGLVEGIAVANGKAYVACRRSGLYVLNVSDPTAPAIIGFYNTNGAFGVALDGSIAYLGDGGTGLRLFDISDPTAPKLISTLDTPGSAERVKIGTFSNRKCAVVADGWGGAVRIIDVTTPSAPIEISSLPNSLGYYQPDFKSIGNTLYISGLTGAVQVFDMGNPSQPVFKGASDEYCDGVIDVVGTTVYSRAANSYLKILDASNPSNVSRIYSGNLGYSIDQIRVSNGVAFIASKDGGFKSLSVANISTPSPLATGKGLGGVGKLVGAGSALLTGGDNKGLGTVNISNPAHPVVLKVFDNDVMGAHSVAAKGNTAVTPSGVVDITNLASPIIRATSSFINPGSSDDVTFVGNDAVFAVSVYLGGGVTNSRLDRFSLANPSSPQLVSSLPLADAGGHLYKILASGNWLFATAPGASNYFCIVDYSTPSTPRIAGKILLPTDVYGGIAATSDANYVYVASIQHGLYIVDARNKSAPVLAGTFGELPWATDAYVLGTRLYVTYYSTSAPSKVVVYDISIPTQPVQVAYYNLPIVSTYGSSTEVVGDLVYLAGGDAGVTVLKVRDLDKPLVSIASPTSNSTYETSNAAVSLNGTSSDNVGVVRVLWSNDRGGGGVAGGTSTWTVPSVTLAPGANHISIVAEDADGNQGQASLVINLKVEDTSVPLISITGPKPDDEFAVNSPSLTLSGSTADDQGVSGVTWTNDRGGDGVATVAGGGWSIPDLALQEGPNKITVTATDAAGNASSDSAVIFYLPPDQEAPSVTIDFPTVNATYETAYGTINLSGESSDDQFVSNVTWSNSRGGSGTTNGTSPWSVNNIPLQEGLNVIDITATDSSGNVSTDTLSVMYSPIVVPSPTPSVTSSVGSTLEKPRGLHATKIKPSGSKMRVAIAFTASADRYVIRARGREAGGKWSHWKTVKRLPAHGEDVSTYVASLRLKPADVYQIRVIAISGSGKIKSKVLTVRAPKTAKERPPAARSKTQKQRFVASGAKPFLAMQRSRR